MTNLIQRITEAIFRQEGMPSTYVNPGNLRYAPWMTHPVIKDGFWQPLTRMQGVAGAAHVVALRIAEGQSLRQLITAWAPPVENATNTYVANVAEWAAIPDVDCPLWMFIEEDSIPT